MDPRSRRDFLRSASLVIAAHATLPAFAQVEDRPVEFRRIRLRSTNLDAQADFYSKKLGLPVKQSDGMLSIKAGRSTIEFLKAAEGTRPVYHFAFNIPENKLDESIEWLRPRIPIVERPNGGGQIYHFANWNAHSCYFLDAAGNILEFIARHTLPNASQRKFSVDDVQSVSEIGLVTPAVGKLAGTLRSAFGVENYKSGDSEDFLPLGNEHGLFILVRTGRIWLGLPEPAAVFPVEVSLRGAPKRIAIESLPFVVESAS